MPTPDERVPDRGAVIHRFETHVSTFIQDMLLRKGKASAADMVTKYLASASRGKMSDMRRIVSGDFELPISAAEAIGFFTPEGERDWVPGWNPVYPAGEVSESSGTVFTTVIGGVDTIWVVQTINRDDHSASYSRVTPGHHAGTVHVKCVDGADGGCTVVVTYDMSLLAGGDPEGLAAYDDRPFAAMMDEWAAEVSRALTV